MAEKHPKPLDVRKLKETVQHESARMYLSSFASSSGKGESAFTLALALCAAVKKIFYEKSATTFSSEPKLVKKPIIQFIRKMRVDAMEKFNSTTVFSIVDFAPNEEGLEKQVYMISIVVYLEQKFLPEFLRLLQYPYIDSDDEMEVKDGCGTIVNLIAGQYKREMAQLGYKDMMMSHFESYINSAPDGVGIPDGPTEKYEISFEVEGTKRLVVEMITLSMLPKWDVQVKTETKKILVIDDDPTYFRTIESFLQSKNYKVLGAYDGRQGLERLKEKPDLIILDLEMPNMDGYDFILEMKEMVGGKHVPILIMTSREGLNDIVKVEGVKEYMIKPINPLALLKSIERYI